MGFQENLKFLRRKNNISQKKLANEIGVAQSSINYWEKGERTPSFEGVRKIANFFNVSLQDLLDEDYCARKIREEEKIIEMRHEEAVIEATKEAARKRAMDIIKKYRLDDYFLTKSDYIPREWAEIKQYAEYIKSKRNSSDDIMDPNNWETD